MAMDKQWYQSKGKIGAALVAGAGVLALVGGFLQGTVDFATLLNGLMAIGSGIGIWGVRDAQG